ncbi:cytochrome bc1 complex cytochrome b subunit [Actinomadura rupiterrae]|uniref:cytochrome bc1 complex cytochrome b subunit n=1 Tax=Actinomadura rupiterrae TaxID=559627 RepID=UPI0020A26405|nr:cytochrome b N-terminal domain-containing protein [Actinomadura rupiterrae]MCP2343567.1 ubiquinol-cytochrome c reductase cytochrome b subunit [Actinomadura rupiterrae]
MNLFSRASGKTGRGLPVGTRLRQSVREDEWSSLFAQIAVYSFGVLLVTGVFLLFFFDPSMEHVRYGGSYTRLDGAEVSRAYASTLHISFDVRGGLLMRQVHHWATLIFTGAVFCQLVRMFVTGAFRRPRVPLWLAWVAMSVLGMAAGVTGGLLPDDMLSGGSLGLIQGVTQSVPVVGTGLTYAIFGGDFPGDVIVSRAYWLHITVLPLAIAGLFVLRHRLVGRHGPGDVPDGRARRIPQRPVSVAIFFYTVAILVLLGTFAQINPVWLYGPYEPGAISAGAVPDWYMGFLDGAVRIMPGWEIDIAGHPLTLAVLVPALIVPGTFFTLLAAYPWLERRITGDHSVHHVLDRPRDAATRTGIGAALVACYAILWAAASNDQIAVDFHLSLYAVTWFFRIAVFIGPLLAHTLTRRLCHYLTTREREEAAHGFETGRIVMTPDGGFTEIHKPVHRELTPAAAPPQARSS